MFQTTSRVRRGVALLAALALLAMGSNAAMAKTIRKHNLVELMTHSDSIVVGTVTEKTDGFQGGLPYTEITLNVGRSLKGDHGQTFSFRQFGLIEPRATGDGRVNLMVTPSGWPTYAVGEQVMLFLHKPASKTGLQTTAALTQGKFTIRDGRIANGIDNEALFAGVRISANLDKGQRELLTRRSGAYPTADFLSLVETAVRERWIEKGVMTHE